jgi:hypothetical protein
MTINARDYIAGLPEEEQARIQRLALEMFARIPTAELPFSDEEYEDLLDNLDADAAMEDVKLHGTIPWEEVKRELGLTPPPPPASSPDKG